MLNTSWPYILRFALSGYFLFTHLPTLIASYKGAAMGETIFSCTAKYIPAEAAFLIWHGIFVLLGILILAWPRPVSALAFSFVILLCEMYLKLSMKTYDAMSMLIFVCILINVALLVIYGRLRTY